MLEIGFDYDIGIFFCTQMIVVDIWVSDSNYGFFAQYYEDTDNKR